MEINVTLSGKFWWEYVSNLDFHQLQRKSSNVQVLKPPPPRLFLGTTGECEQTKRGRKTKKIKIKVEDTINQKKIKEIFKIMKKESP